MKLLRCVLMLPLVLLGAAFGRPKTGPGNRSNRAMTDSKIAVRQDSAGSRGETEERHDECLQSIIDGLDDEVMIIAPDFSVKQINSALSRRLGLPAVAVVGQPCYRVTHGAQEPCRLPWCECPLKRAVETGHSSRVVHNHWEGNDSDSTEKWMEIMVSPIRDSQGNVTEVMEIMRDVSESKRVQKDFFRVSRELLALSSIASALNQSLDLTVTLQTVAETVLDALEAEASWIRLTDDKGKTPAVRASRGLTAKTLEGLIEVASRKGAAEQAETSVSYAMAGSGKDESSHTLRQVIVTPLRSKGVILGTAGVVARQRVGDQQRIQLLEAICSQVAVAVERCRLYEEVEAARDLRGELLHQAITAQEEERKRIARELHDETGQALTALRLSIERLSLMPVTSIEEMKAQLGQPLGLCEQAEEEIDKLIFDLRPTLLDDLGLVEAIRSYAQARLGALNIEVDFRVSGKERRFGGEKEAALFRVVQEGINNIIKHAQAKNVIIHLNFQKNQLITRVVDDGWGFETSRIVSAQDPSRGLGLLGMRERMSLVGGSLSITSKPGAGTRLKAVVPLDEEGIHDEDNQNTPGG